MPAMTPETPETKQGSNTPTPHPNAAGRPESGAKPSGLRTKEVFGRTWGPREQADGSIIAEIVFAPEVAAYLKEQSATAGEALQDTLQKTVDEAMAMYCSA